MTETAPGGANQGNRKVAYFYDGQFSLFTLQPLLAHLALPQMMSEPTHSTLVSLLALSSQARYIPLTYSSPASLPLEQSTR